MMVSSIADAQKALACQWRNKEAATYNEAARLLSAARDGVCKPEAAFEAFKEAAHKQGLIQPTKPSSALGRLDKLISR